MTQFSSSGCNLVDCAELLTADDFGHVAGGINTADVFRMGGVGVIAKQERCTYRHRNEGCLQTKERQDTRL